MALTILTFRAYLRIAYYAPSMQLLTAPELQLDFLGILYSQNFK